MPRRRARGPRRAAPPASRTRSGRARRPRGVLLLRVAQAALRYGEGDLAVADAAFLAEQDRGHADLVRALLRNEDRGMTVRAVEPLGVLLVRVHDVGHRALHFAHDVE